jgi:hypothetical protein
MHTEWGTGHKTFWAACHQVLYIITIATVWTALTCAVRNASSGEKLWNFIMLQTLLCFIPTSLRHSATGPISPRNVRSPVTHHLKCKLNSNQNVPRPWDLVTYDGVLSYQHQCSHKDTIKLTYHCHLLQLTGTEWYWLKHPDSTAVTGLAVHAAVIQRAQQHCVNGQVVPGCQRNVLLSSWRVKGQVGQGKWQMTVSYSSWTAWPCRWRYEWSFKTLRTRHPTTQCHIPEDTNLQHTSSSY